MNRIVKEHYPASKLPEDLREGLAPGVEVTVTVEVFDGPRTHDRDVSFVDALLRRPEHILTLEEMFAMRQPTFKTVEEIDEHIRHLRDEWD